MMRPRTVGNIKFYFISLYEVMTSGVMVLGLMSLYFFKAALGFNNLFLLHNANNDI